MGNWLKRLRGTLGLGAIGGAAGALFGSLWWFGTNLLGLQFTFGSLGMASAVWGGFGAFAASGAALLLAAFGSRQTLEELSPWRVAAFGAAMGFLAPPGFIFMVTGSFWAPGVASFGLVAFIATISALLGAGLGGGLVLSAQRAPIEELTDGALESLGAGPETAQ